jgi:hypothetical protein
MEPFDLYEAFIEKLGQPDSDTALREYLNFIRSSGYTIDELLHEYSEIHHILPRANFPEYQSNSWNMVRLKYTDHIRAHELLATAYQTRQYLKTLIFMNSQVSKNSEIVSAAAKRGWETLKNNEKMYTAWRKKKSEYMLNLSSEEKSKRANRAWETTRSNDDRYKKRCESNSKIWNDDLREWKSRQMSEYFIQNPDEQSRRGFIRWQNMSDEDRLAFSNKMRDSLSDPTVKAKISEKLKEKWSDSAFANKMKSRKTYLHIYELTSPTGDVFVRTGADSMIKEFDFSPSLVRKFSKLGVPVESTYLANKQVRNTVGWTFKKMN